MPRAKNRAIKNAQIINQGEIKTLTAQGRMSGLIISLLPPILLLVMIFMNPDHISVMFSNILGIIMLVTAVVSELIGIYMVKKVVDIEV